MDITDTLHDLHPGPWALDPETGLWVTLDGRVARPASLRDDGRFYKPRWCRFTFHKQTGYISLGGTFIHRIIARAWLPNPSNKRVVNHKDGDKTNNSIENLEWATHGENLKHAYDNELREKARTPELEKAVREALASGKRFWGATALARKFNVGTTLLKSIATEIRNER